MSGTAPAPITIYSTWRGIIASLVSALILAGLGIWAMVLVGRFAIPAAIVAAVGLVLGWVALFDYPHASTFDEEGITRRCLLRRDHIAWDEVAMVDRATGGLIRGHRVEGASRLSVGLGGLVARRGRRRYLLVNHVESPPEYDDLQEGMNRWAPTVVLRALPPPDSVPPSWIYRRGVSGKGDPSH